MCFKCDFMYKSHKSGRRVDKWQKPSRRRATNIGISESDISDAFSDEGELEEESEPSMVFPGRLPNSGEIYEVRLAEKRQQLATRSTRYRTIEMKYPRNKVRDVPVITIPKKTY